MKKLLLFAVLVCLSVTRTGAQEPVNNQVVYVSSAPSGSCAAAAPIQVLSTNGVVYTCNNGTWGIDSSGAASQALSYTSAGTLPSSSTTGLFSYGTLNFTDSGQIEAYQASTNGYIQNVIENTNAGTSASADFIVGNSSTTATTFYGDFGMNGTNFSGTGNLTGLASETYLYGTSGDLGLGTLTANNIHVVTDNSTADAITVTSTGATTAGTVTVGAMPVFSASTAHGLLKGEAGSAVASMAVCGSNFPIVGVTLADPVCSTIGWLSSATQWGIPYMSTATQMSTTAALTANALIKAGSSAAPSASTIIDNGTFVKSTEIFKGNNTQVLTSNSSGITATTPGTTQFTWGALPVSTNFSLHCSGTYSQATAAGGTGIAIQGATNAPTRIDAWSTIYTTNPASTTVTGSQGAVVNLATTTATSIVSDTPAATGTNYIFTIDGTVQVGASATTLNILFYTGNASDAVTVNAGSYCTLMP